MNYRAARIVCECGARIGWVEADTEDPTKVGLRLQRTRRTAWHGLLGTEDPLAVAEVPTDPNSQLILSGCPRCRRLLDLSKADLRWVTKRDRPPKKLPNVVAHPR